MGSVSSPGSPLVFGIYPGGAAGTVNAASHPKAEDPGKRLAALEQLRPPGRPFVVHLYAAFTGAGGWSAAQQVGEEISQYSAAGLQTELVLTYRPADGGSPSSVQDYMAFVRQAVDAFGPDRNFVSLQVTNEANLAGAPNASDGYYRGASDALVSGVVAAKRAVVAGGFTQVKVGFNWAYDTGSAQAGFWHYLSTRAAELAPALDWVGLDVYPGTWGPSIGPVLAIGTTATMTEALSLLRHHMSSAGIPASMPLHISENGYPTGPGRTEAMQVTAMRAAIAAVVAARSVFHVSDYRWFDLRDADSSSDSFENAYGLMTDSYTPKAAFSAYRDLVAQYS